MVSQRGRTLTAHFVGDADSLLRALNQVDRGAATTQRSTSSLSNGIAGLRSNWIAVTAAVAAFSAATYTAQRVIMGSINAASDYEESINKIDVVFGSASESVKEWVETQSLAFRQSKREAAEAVGTFGNLIVSLGGSSEAAAEMSTRMVALAGDLSSFNNVPTAEALTAIRAGIVGEIEPLRRLGVSFNAVQVENKALELGLASTKKELTEGDKVTARYNLILEQTATAQGDAARTSDTWAAQTKLLSDQMDNLRVTVGDELLPVAVDFLTTLNEIVAQDGAEWAAALSTSLGAVAEAFIFATERATDFIHGLQIVGSFITGGGAGVQDLLEQWKVQNGIYGMPGVGSVGPSPILPTAPRSPFTVPLPPGFSPAGAPFGPFQAADPTRPVGPGNNPRLFGASGYGGAGGSVNGTDPFALAQERALMVAQKRMDELAVAAGRAAEALDKQTASIERQLEITDVGDVRFVWAPTPGYTGDPRFDPGTTYSSADFGPE